MKSIFLIWVSILMIAGCASVKVGRMDAGSEVDLSGYWNDTDSRLVAEEVIKDCLGRGWLPEFSSRAAKKPRVIVGTVKNMSSEHIATATFVKDMERELINSGKVVFVSGGREREEIRQERAEQQKFSEDAKAFFKEKAADFMLQGDINSILDSAGKQTLRYYQIELELIDMESNEKVWIGQKKIKKLVKRSKFGL
ncbi:MAG: penicillin-binding protein activator LpoB [Elusimicrobia bacterium CG_4_10_14_3_um_filter_49_12_50_7]|nr:MAG: penicillin-binding protein activator LpoB [Elusimicrobia bacterium CG_4_10_14_3_um_filter_49_12_50_7]